MANRTIVMGNRELFSVARDILLEGSSVRVAVRGQSMLPFFRSGSIIELFPVKDEDITLYGVVMADAGNSFVVHRIIAVDGERVTLLGDGNYLTPEYVTRDKIYGVVRCSTQHIFFAKLWVRIRRYRRFPLAILRRLCRK